MLYAPIRTEIFDFREDSRRAFTIYVMPDGRVYLVTKTGKVYSGLYFLTYRAGSPEMVPMTKSQVKATYLKDISYPALDTTNDQDYLRFECLVGGERMCVYSKLMNSAPVSFVCDNRRRRFRMDKNTLEVECEYGYKYEGPCLWKGSEHGVCPMTKSERALVDPVKISSAEIELTSMGDEYLRLVIEDTYVYYKMVIEF